MCPPSRSIPTESISSLASKNFRPSLQPKQAASKQPQPSLCNHRVYIHIPSLSHPREILRLYPLTFMHARTHSRKWPSLPPSLPSAAPGSFVAKKSTVHLPPAGVSPLLHNHFLYNPFSVGCSVGRLFLAGWSVTKVSLPHLGLPTPHHYHQTKERPFQGALHLSFFSFFFFFVCIFVCFVLFIALIFVLSCFFFKFLFRLLPAAVRCHSFFSPLFFLRV